MAVACNGWAWGRSCFPFHLIRLLASSANCKRRANKERERLLRLVKMSKKQSVCAETEDGQRADYGMNANCIRHNNRGTVTLKCVVVDVIGIGNAFDFLLSRTWENWRRGMEAGKEQISRLERTRREGERKLR